MLKMNEPLYKITDALQEALDAVYVDEEGVLHGWADYEAVTFDWETKAEALACYIKQLQAEAHDLQDEEDALYERRQAKERKAARLIHYLAQNITAAGRTRFETSRVDCRFRRSSHVEVSDVESLPAEFINERVTKTPNKVAIRSFIEKGGELPGCEIREITRLNIK